MCGKFEQFKKSMNGVTVSVVGVGVSNRPLIKLLVEAGANVVARDKKQAHYFGDFYNDLCEWNVKTVFGDDYLKGMNEAVIFKSPGIRYDIPEFIQAENNGAVITSEMETFLDVCPAKIIAVTGSDGKTTTTTLIHKILQRQGYSAWLGGNIGIPLLSETGRMSEHDIVVLELSSFQLHTMKKSPHIAVVTNISPNHLDMHKSYDEYIKAKSNIMLYQCESDKLILNYDNIIVKDMAKYSKAETVFFSSKTLLDKGFYVDGDYICYSDGSGCNVQKILRIDEILLPGKHNVENYMAAIAAVHHLALPEAIVETAKNFKGVEHRIEFVRNYNGVSYYNDSSCSSPTRTQAALMSFDKNVVLIAGGYDKKIPFDNLACDIINKTKAVVLIGDSADKIRQSIINSPHYNPAFPISIVDSLQQALKAARDHAVENDVVLLSPACASFDMFTNFEERGNIFKQLVNSIESL